MIDNDNIIYLDNQTSKISCRNKLLVEEEKATLLRISRNREEAPIIISSKNFLEVTITGLPKLCRAGRGVLIHYTCKFVIVFLCSDNL